MSGPRAFVEYLWVNSDPVIAEPDAEFLHVVPNLNFNLFSARMAESVSQNLPANPIERVLKNRPYLSGRSFDGDAESRDDATVRRSNSRKVLPGVRQQSGQVAAGRGAFAQVQNGIPALGNGRLGAADRFVQSLNCVIGASWKEVPGSLNFEQRALEALKQRVVQVTSDARALCEPRLESLGHMINALTVCGPRY